MPAVCGLCYIAHRAAGTVCTHYNLHHMNPLYVHAIPNPVSSISLQQLSVLLDAQPRQSISIAPWAAFTYKPEVAFSIAHFSTGIALKFFVREEAVRAVNTSVNGQIWEDSCVEFFLKPGTGDAYYNIEFNCLGAGLIAYGPHRAGRRFLAGEVVEKIQALSQIQSRRPNGICWELTLQIPLEVFQYTSIPSLRNLRSTANFYKCGDLLPTPHYLAWKEIHSTHPDFHSTLR